MAGPNYGLIDNALVNRNRALEGYGSVNALVAQTLENQASRNALESAEAERAAAASAGGDTSKLISNMMQVSPKTGVALTKGLAAARKDDVEAVNTRLKTSAALSDLAQTPEQMAQIMRGDFSDPLLGPLYQRMGLTPEKTDAMLAEASKTPEGFRQFKMQRVMGMKGMYDQLNNEAQLKVSQRNSDISAGQLGVAQGNLSLTRQKFALDQAEKGPEGQVLKDIQSNTKALKTAGYNPETGEDKVSELIQKSTSGRGEALGAALVGAAGGATSGMKAIGQLDTISKTMTLDLLNNKLGAGISNADREALEARFG